MRRSTRLAFLAPLFWGQACAHGMGRAPRDEPTRFVTVCVLLDTVHAVSVAEVNKAIAHVSAEYMVHVNIGFTIVGYRNYAGDNYAPAVTDFLHKHKDSCSRRGEIRMLFSGDSGRPYTVTVPKAMRLGKADTVRVVRWNGLSDSWYGTLSIARFDTLLAMKDGGGHTALYTVLTHEIGHLFGLGHAVNVQDTTSFMYPYVEEGTGGWTPDIISGIRKNRKVKWWH